MNNSMLFECLAVLSKKYGTWEILRQYANSLSKLSDDEWLLQSCSYLVGSKAEAYLDDNQQLLSIIFSVKDGFKYLPDIQSERSFVIVKHALIAHLMAEQSNSLTVDFIEHVFKNLNTVFHDKLCSFLCENSSLITPEVVYALHRDTDLTRLATLLSANQMIVALDGLQDNEFVDESTYLAEMTL